MATDEKVAVKMEVEEDKSEAATSVANDKKVETATSVVNDKKVEAATSVANDKKVEAATSVANDKKVEAATSVANDKKVEAAKSVAKDKKVEANPKENSVNKSKSKDITSAEAANLHYRVKVSGLPRFYTPLDPLLLDFKTLLRDELGLQFQYIRSPKKGNSWLYITFYNQDDQEEALKLLKHYIWKGRTLICTLVVADVLKRKQEDSTQDTSKRPRLDIPIEEQMLMSTIPYHTVSYEEQLSKKNEEAQHLLKWLADCMEKKTPELIGYIDQEIAKNTTTKLPFKLEDVRASPVIDGYRNKCEFRIGVDPQTKKVVVGYRVDNQEDDSIAVAPPDTLRHLPKEMIDIVKVFEKLVQASPYKPQKSNHDDGVWRLLHVRVNKNKQMMVVVLINPTVLDDAKISQLKQQLIDYFSNGPASGFNVVSLYLHTDNDVKSLSQVGGDKLKRPQGKLELLWGQPRMEEQLLDLKLQIDPNFYFQNNTWGAEVLYKAVMELAGVDKETTVLDLCCGSGGMGMMFAKHCKEVIGVEVMDVNVDDAKNLAALNGLTNCEFLQGAVDDLFPVLEEKLKGKKVVPILDPPRVGISKRAIASLRKLSEVSRIIYVCSNHKPPVKNLLDLASLDKKSPFEDLDPFVVKHAIPLDLAPHTLRCELVILCERLSVSELPKSNRSAPKIAKKAAKKNPVQHKKRWQNPNSAHAGRSNFFPTEDMVRRYSSMRKPKQDIDYQKRDSLYPLPLRGALYQGMGDEPPPYFPHPEKSFRSNGYSNQRDFVNRPSYTGRGTTRNGDTELARYSDFRRDMEVALDESTRYTPGRQLTSRKLAYANALLEEGIRIASEVLETDYPRRPSTLGNGYYGRENTRSSNKYRY